jgi:hypothetical protein
MSAQIASPWDLVPDCMRQTRRLDSKNAGTQDGDLLKHIRWD